MSSHWRVFNPHWVINYLPDEHWRTLMWLRPNRRLRSFDSNYPYSLTIDGYQFAELVWKVVDVSEKVQSYQAADSSWDGPFEDLRCCLFHLQRRIRWAESGGPDTEGRRMYNSLYRAVCDAWDREFRSHQADLETAYKYLDSISHEIRTPNFKR